MQLNKRLRPFLNVCLVRLWDTKKPLIMRGKTQSEDRSQRTSASSGPGDDGDFLSFLLMTHKRVLWPLSAPTTKHVHLRHTLTVVQCCIFACEKKTHTTTIDAHSTESTSHTHLRCALTHWNMHAHTLLHTPTQCSRDREVKTKSLTSSCIMCLKCSRDAAKQAVTVTALRRGGITLVSCSSDS